MSKVTSKGNQDISCNNDQSKIDVEQIDLETVPQNLLNSNENFSNTKGLNFVKLSKETAMTDDNVLNAYNDVAVKGLKYVLWFYDCRYKEVS